MLQIRRSEERGRADHGWLDTRHTFSFANYYDPSFMGFRALRVINDDRVKGGAGFPTHPHRDMEIISYVVDGALEHKDSTGTGSVIRPGEVQRMSAGSGIAHSEWNHSADDTVRFLQIWIIPAERGLKPGYEQRMFGDKRRNTLELVASPDGSGDSVTIHQDVRVYASVVDAGQPLRYELPPERYAWVQVVRGDITVNGETLNEGDGVAVAKETVLDIAATTAAELLLFDLA